MSENLWNNCGVPHKGWRAYAVDDLGDDRISCEMCNKTEIRWAHYMEHPNHPTVLRVGCVCAENMEENYNGQVAENAAKRKTNWTQRWKKEQSSNVSYQIKKIDKDLVIIFEHDNLYYWLVERDNTDEYHGVNIGGYTTDKLAKQAVWKMYEDEGWL